MKHSSVVFALLLLLSRVTFSQQAPDVILFNGKVFTADQKKLYAEALAIKGNSIIAVGSNQEITKFATANTRKIDLKGRTVVPGFNDAHDHLGYNLPLPSFFQAEFSIPGLDKKSILDSLSKILTRVNPGKLIGGPIGLQGFFDPGMRAALDSVAPGNPVILYVMWGHGMVVNTAAMRLLHIPEEARDIEGGWYQRIPGTNQVTGALFEGAQWPGFHLQNLSEPELMIRGLHDFARQQIKMGITTVQDMSCSFPPEKTVEFISRAKFQQRVRLIPMPGSFEGIDLSAWKKVNQHPSATMYVSGVKYVIDGTPFEQTALQRTPYPDRGSWYGRLNYSEDKMKKILQDAYDGKEQLMMHITGDSAMGIVLDMMKKTGTDEIWKTRRVRFEHNASGLATDADRRKIREMGIIMAHTPKYGHRSRLRTLIDEGIIVSVSPDGTTNPFWDIMAMVSQQVDPKENLTREQAVIAFTKTNAYGEFAEKNKGMLTKGMLADLAVLSDDLFTIADEKLQSIKSVLTMVDGKIVYDVLPDKSK